MRPSCINNASVIVRYWTVSVACITYLQLLYFVVANVSIADCVVVAGVAVGAVSSVLTPLIGSHPHVVFRISLTNTYVACSVMGMDLNVSATTAYNLGVLLHLSYRLVQDVSSLTFCMPLPLGFCTLGKHKLSATVSC